jgi:TRAP transporter 4TM/12TM fusion protein
MEVGMAEDSVSGPVTNQRKLDGVAGQLLKSVYVLIVGIAMFWAFDLADFFEGTWQRAQYLALFLGLVLLGSFMLYSPVARSGPQTRVPWYDWLLGLTGLVVGLYPAFAYEALVTELHNMPPIAVALGAIGVALLMEAVRRAAGMPLVVICGAFIAYAFVSEWMPGDFYNRAIAPDRLAMYLYLDANAILGAPLAISMGIVLAFIFFGAALGATGAADFYTNMAGILMGRYKGGAGKISVLASAMMGSISGSAVSNVVSTGVITIPMMRKSGFKPVQAAAIEAAASTGGQILPPVMGATAFLMAEFLNIPYSDVALAALIPALLYFVAVFLYVHLIAHKYDLAGYEVEQAQQRARAIAMGSIYLVPLVVLVYALFALDLRPERAAYLSAFVAVAIHLLLTRGRGRGQLGIVFETGQMSLQIALITAVAGIVIGVLNLTGLGFTLTLVLKQVGQINLVILLVLVALVCLVLGMGMPSTGVYLILAVLVAPAITELNVSAIAAHMFIMYYGVFSFVTPPVCFAAFAAATIAGSGPMRTGFEASRMLSATYFVPFLFIFHPGLLMQGSVVNIVAGALSALVMVYLVTAAVVGYGRKALSNTERVVVASAALVVMIYISPTDLLDYLFLVVAAAVGLTIALRSERAR